MRLLKDPELSHLMFVGEDVIQALCVYREHQDDFINFIELKNIYTSEDKKDYGSIVLKKLKQLSKRMGFQEILVLADKTTIGFWAKNFFWGDSLEIVEESKISNLDPMKNTKLIHFRLKGFFYCRFDKLSLP